MPLDTELQHGDRVTFSQPRQGEFLVLFACAHQDGRMGVILADEFMGIGELLHKGLKVTYVSRPVHEVVLPTEPGYYTPKNQVYIDTPLTLFRNGEWVDGYGRTMSEERLHYLMPLTRLVPETAPAKLADRLDFESLNERLRSMRMDPSVTWAAKAKALIAAIDNGELDK